MLGFSLLAVQSGLNRISVRGQVEETLGWGLIIMPL